MTNDESYRDITKPLSESQLKLLLRVLLKIEDDSKIIEPNRYIYYPVTKTNQILLRYLGRKIDPAIHQGGIFQSGTIRFKPDSGLLKYLLGLKEYIQLHCLKERKTRVKKQELSYSQIHLDLNKATLKYKNNDPVDISPMTNEVKFLKLLLLKEGDVLENLDAVKELGLAIPDHSDTNTSYNRNIGDVRKGLKKLLLRCGMNDDEFQEVVKCVEKVGYKLSS